MNTTDLENVLYTLENIRHYIIDWNDKPSYITDRIIKNRVDKSIKDLNNLLTNIK